MDSKISELFKKTGLKTFLFRNSKFDDPNFYYFSQINESNLEKNASLLKKGKKPIVLTTFLEEGILKKYKNIRLKRFAKNDAILSFYKKALVGKVGINFGAFTKKDFDFYKKEFKKAKFIDVSEKLAELRATKTEKEIKKISKAIKISEKTINEISNFFRKGMTEKELALELEFALKKNGAEGIAFSTIVAFGKNSGIPHYVPQNRKIKEGLLLIDFGAKYHNYCSDITRTFFAGKAGKKEKELYAKVFEAKKLAEQKITEGAKAFEIFNDINSFLKKECGQELKHGLGHGLGLEVHDFPSGFTSVSKDILKEKMVLTVEPGIYEKFGGIRIEDDIVVRKKKCRKLSSAPEELIELK